MTNGRMQPLARVLTVLAMAVSATAMLAAPAGAGDEASHAIEASRPGANPVVSSFEALLTIAHPAVAERWSADDIRDRLGTPARSVEVAEAPGRSWLVYTFGDRQLLVALQDGHVVAVQVEFRTKQPRAFDAAVHATSLRLGAPSERSRHEAAWLAAGLSVRLAGWRGEFNLSVGPGADQRAGAGALGTS